MIRSSYILYICPECGEGRIFAGFCEDHGTWWPRLVPVKLVPASSIQDREAAPDRQTRRRRIRDLLRRAVDHLPGARQV